jgi:hypothetical protein
MMAGQTILAFLLKKSKANPLKGNEALLRQGNCLLPEVSFSNLNFVRKVEA